MAEIIISWIQGFLHGRQFKVHIHGSVSKWKPVLSGIPQGSVLGPFLIITYINALEELCNLILNMYLFADDAKLYKPITYNNDIDTLQEGINYVKKWTNQWQLQLIRTSGH